MLTMSRSFPARSCPALLCRVPSVGTAPGFGVCLNPEPFWDFTSRLLTAVVKRHDATCARDGTPAWGGCGTRAPGEGTDPGRARSPPGAMVSDLRSSAYPSAARGPLRPEQPY